MTSQAPAASHRLRDQSYFFPFEIEVPTSELTGGSLRARMSYVGCRMKAVFILLNLSFILALAIWSNDVRPCLLRRSDYRCRSRKIDRYALQGPVASVYTFAIVRE